MAAPAPGSPVDGPVSTEGARGEWAPYSPTRQERPRGRRGSMVLSKAVEWLLAIVFGLLMVELMAPILLGW